jgi:adenylate cyclase
VLADASYEAPLGEAVSLTDRMRALGFSPTEFALLRSAQDRSDELADIEGSAFAALEAGEQQIAVELVTGSEYLQAKASIMEPINQFLAAVQDRTSDEIAGAQEQPSRLSAAVLAVVVVLLGATIALGVLWRRL